MKRTLLAVGLVALVTSGCGNNEDPSTSDVQLQTVAEGLNYPNAIAYVGTAKEQLAAGTVLVGLAGTTGANGNSVVAVSPSGAVSGFVNASVVASGNRPVVNRPTGIDTQGPFVALTNFADSLGSVAFLNPAGQPLAAAIRNGLLDARDFGFTVTGVQPPNGTTINEVRPTIRVFLSQAVNPSTVNNTRFSLDRVGSSLDPNTTFEIATDGRSMSLVPDGSLIPGISYKVKISTAVKDIHGNGMDSDPFTPKRQGFESTFRISGQAPVLRVRTVNPEDREANVPLNSKVVVGFTLPVDINTVTDSSFFVANSGGQKVAGAISFSSDHVTAIFTPSSNYAVSTTYKVTLTPDIRDEAGNAFDADPGGDPTSFFSTFTTASTVDTTPPTVTKVDPANGGVAPTQTVVTVTFSEAVDETTVTRTSFRVERNGSAVGSNVTVAPNGLSAVLTPTSALAEGSTFTVIVTTDVADRSGNKLQSQFSSTFSTKASTIVINEVVMDPQRDWNDTDGGDGVPFNAVPGTGSKTDSDEWIELYNASNQTFNLRGWTLEMRDTTSATHVIGSPPSGTSEICTCGNISSFGPGAFLVIGNPAGEINNDLYLVLKDTTNAVVDDVEIGDDPESDGNGDGAPDPGTDGNANSAADEAVARRPNGTDSNNDVNDFVKQQATIGSSNNAGRVPLAALPGIDGGATGVAYGGKSPDDTGSLSEMYFIASSNNEGLLVADLDDEVYQITDFFNPRGLLFDAVGTGEGYLYVLNDSLSTGESGISRLHIIPTGSVGSAGTQVQVAPSDQPDSFLSFVHPLFKEPVGIAYDRASRLIYVANRNDGTVLEIDFNSTDPQILRVFKTGLPAERIGAAEFGERGGKKGLFLADTGAGGLDDGPQGALLFFPIP